MMERHFDVENAFEELFKASPLPKNIQEQWQLEEALGKVTRLTSPLAVHKPNTNKAGTLGWKARLLQSMQKGSNTNSSHQGEYRHLNATDILTQGRVSNSSALNKLSTTLPEGRKKICLSTNKVPPTSQFVPICSTPTKDRTTPDLCQTPVLKSQVNAILSRLDSDDCDEEPRTSCNKPATSGSCDPVHLEVDGGNQMEQSELVGSQSPDSSTHIKPLLSGIQTKATEWEDHGEDCVPLHSTTRDSPVRGAAGSHSDSLPQESEQEQPKVEVKAKLKKSLGKSKKEKKTRAATELSVTKADGLGNSSGASSKPTLDDTPTSRRSGGKATFEKPPHVLHRWIIKPMAQQKGVYVEGHRSHDPAEQYWQSSEIVERVDNKTVLTSSGREYKLVGDIERSDALEAGFSKTLIRKFKTGFPKNWKTLLQNFFSTENNQACNKPCGGVQENVSTKHRQSKPDQSISVVVPSPVLEELPCTRSGRRVKPQLAWYMGQRVRVHSKTGQVEITPVRLQTPSGSFNSTPPDLVKQSRDKCRMESKTGRLKKKRQKSKGEISDAKPDAKTSHHKGSDKKNGNKTDSTVVVLRDIHPTGGRPVSRVTDCDNPEAQPELDNSVELEVLSVLAQHKKQQLSTRQPRSTQTSYNKVTDQPSDTSDEEISKGPKNSGKKYTAIQVTKDGDCGLRTETFKPAPRLTRSSQALRTKSVLDTSGGSCSKEVSKSESKSHRGRASRRRSAVGKRCSSQSLVERPGKEQTGGRQKRKPQKRVSRTQQKKNYECETDSSSESESELRRTLAQHKRPAGAADISVPPVAKLFSDQRKAVKTKTKKNNGETKSISKPKRGKQGGGKSSSTANGERRTECSKELVVNPETWSKQETDNLYRAVTKHSPDDPCFWMLVSAAVATRSEEECQEFYYQSAAMGKLSSRDSKPQTKAAKPSKPVALTGKVGTLKRKRELRQLVDQHNEGYEDDFFDSTPMRKHTYKAPAMDDEDEDDLFGDKLPFDTPTMTRTPFTRCFAPVSAKKTPYMGQESPDKSDNRHEMDTYINRLKKRRIVSNVNHHKKKSDTTTSVDVQYTDDLFRREEQSDHDSEQESEYYWSDASGT